MNSEAEERGEEGLEEPKIDDVALERRPSWSFGTILVLYFIVFIITPYIGITIGLGLIAVLAVACIWNAVSRKQYEKLKGSYPGLSRSEYMLNNLIFQTVLPLAICAVLALLATYAR